MRLGLYDAIVLDRPLSEVIQLTAELGLTGVELSTGGFQPAAHVPTFDDILVSDAARDDYLGLFEGTGVEIAGLNCNANPLHPNPEIGPRHAEDIRRSIRLAHRLGQHRVVTMSGLPGGEPGSTRLNWVVNSWSSAGTDVLDYQWGIATDLWREIDHLAADHDVKVALELHPHNIVFDTSSVQHLVEVTGATNVGVELDASHLFWQHMDPIAVVRELGSLVFHAAAKDVRINEAAAIHGVLNNRWTRTRGQNLGGDEWVNDKTQPSAWDFVALGIGHPVEYWAEFLRALSEVDSDMWVNIEHEDESLGPIEGLRVSADVLIAANRLIS
jgi:Sugar phosphate isomerases/epimerases